MKFSQSSDDRFVVGVAAVSVKFYEICEQQINKIQRIRTLLVTRNLRALPGPQVGVKFAAQFRNLLADAFEFRVGVGVAGEVAQFLDIFFETLNLFLAINFLLALDFFLAVGLFRKGGGRSAGFVFFFSLHCGTIRTAGVFAILSLSFPSCWVIFSSLVFFRT